MVAQRVALCLHQLPMMQLMHDGMLMKLFFLGVVLLHKNKTSQLFLRSGEKLYFYFQIIFISAALLQREFIDFQLSSPIRFRTALVASIIFIFNTLVPVRKMASTTTRRVARSAMVGRVVNTVSLSHQPVLQESCTFVVFFFCISRTDISECRARDGE